MTIERDLIISQLDRKISSGRDGNRTVGVDMLKAIRRQMTDDAKLIGVFMQAVDDEVKRMKHALELAGLPGDKISTATETIRRQHYMKGTADGQT